MSVTDPTTGQNTPSRSRRLSMFLPCRGQGTPQIDTMGDTPALFGILPATGDANGIMAKITYLASVNARGGIDLDKSTEIKNTLEKFEKRVWEEAEDYYLPYSPLEKLIRKMERVNKIMEESEKTGNP